RTRAAADERGSGGKNRLLGGLGGGEVLEPYGDVLRHHRSEERSQDDGVKRRRMSEAADLVEAHRAAPSAEEERHFPADPVQLGDVVRGEERTRQGGQVVAVFTTKRHADDTRGDGAALGIGELDVEVEHRLLVDVAKGARLLETQHGAALAG